MRPVVKRLVEELDALGFTSKPHPTRPDCRVYQHANDSGTELKVYTKGQVMKENAVRIVSKRAHKIADIGTTGPRDAVTLREVAHVSRQRRKAERERDTKERNERGARAEAEHQQREALVNLVRKESEIGRLMQPGHGA